MTESEGGHGTQATGSRVGFILGLLVLIACLLTAPPGGLSVLAWRAAGLGLLMAIWWITEAIPIYATALLPLVMLPALGISTMTNTAAPYANPIIYLFMGGFILAAGMESSGLHRRLAVAIIRTVGTRPANLIGGFMAATAFISMWVSNTATVVMLLPMATSVIRAVEAHRGDGKSDSNFPVALLLGIAYAASIGGVATPIGTPPTAFLAAFMDETYHFRVGFLQWMLVGVPIVAVGTPIAWWLLTRILHPVGTVELEGGREIMEREAADIGRMSPAEKLVAIITTLTAVAWMTQPLIEKVFANISDAGIAMTGAMLMFIVPVNWRRGEFVLAWRDAEKMPWSVLVLFGGGLSLAAAIQNTGLAQGIGDAMAAAGHLPLLLVMAMVTLVVIFLTELTSNTATAATFIPLVASVSVGMGRDPLFLAIPAALAAGLSFMLPAGTPPNALIFGTGRLNIPTMARAGLVMNILFAILINIAVFTVAIRVFGLHR